MSHIFKGCSNNDIMSIVLCSCRWDNSTKEKSVVFALVNVIVWFKAIPMNMLYESTTCLSNMWAFTYIVYFRSISGSSAVHGYMFLVSIISKNLWTLKAGSGQTAECMHNLVTDKRRSTNNLEFSIMHIYLAVHINVRKRLI